MTCPSGFCRRKRTRCCVSGTTAAFDPVSYIPKDNEDALGLRLVLAFAEDARYTYALNLNNVCIRIGREDAAGA